MTDLKTIQAGYREIINRKRDLRDMPLTEEIERYFTQQFTELVNEIPCEEKEISRSSSNELQYILRGRNSLVKEIQAFKKQALNQ